MSDDGYRVCRINGCRVIYGEVPITDMVALVTAWTANERDGEDMETVADLDEAWVMDGKLAEALGANLVAGTRRDTKAWRALLKIV